MAFALDLLQPLGGQSRIGKSPQEWGYRSMDPAAVVATAGYFNAARSLLVAGDVITRLTVDGAGVVVSSGTHVVLNVPPFGPVSVSVSTELNVTPGAGDSTGGGGTGTGTGTAPFVLAAPAISGTAKVGATLTITPAVFGGDPAPAVTRELLRDGTPVSGYAGALSYTVVQADQGTHLAIRETASNGVLPQAVAVSAPTAEVAAAGGTVTPPAETRPRVFVTTDCGGSDKDDDQALAILLLYSDVINVVGISLNNVDSRITGSNLARARGLVDSGYALDYPFLSTLSADYPTPAAIKARMVQGALGQWPSSSAVGPATDGSAALVAAAQAAAAAGVPLWVLNWGGEQEVARAIYDAPDIVPTLRLYSISNQDPQASAWLQGQMAAGMPARNLFRIMNMTTFRGVYMTASSNVPKTPYAESRWLGYGWLGSAMYEACRHLHVAVTTTVTNGFKAGDLPSLLYVLDQVARGVGPADGGWGGQFAPNTALAPNAWIDRTDNVLQGYAGAGTVAQYQDTFLAAITARVQRTPRMPAVWISSTPITAAEGSSGTTTQTWSIALGGLTTGTTVVGWTVAGYGTNPSDPADFVGGVFPSGSVTFAPGETSKTVPVPVLPDSSAEANENYILTLTPGSGYQVIQDPAAGHGVRGQAIGTITNDDSSGTPVTALFVGDSMMAGYKANSRSAGGNTTTNRVNPADRRDLAWPKKLCDTLNAAGTWAVTQAGWPVTGQTLQACIDDFEYQVGAPLDAATGAVVVLLMLGSNMDTGDGLPELYARTATLCGMIKARKAAARIVLLGYPWQRGSTPAKSADFTIPHGQNLAATYQALGADRYFSFAVDPFDTPAKAASATYFHTDEVHWIEAGHTKAAELVRPTVEAAFAAAVAPAYPASLIWLGPAGTVAADAAAGAAVGRIGGLMAGMSTAWASNTAAFALAGNALTRSGSGSLAAGTAQVTVSGVHPTLGAKAYQLPVVVTAASSLPVVSIGAGQTVTEGSGTALVFPATRTGADLTGASSATVSITFVTASGADLGTLPTVVSFAAGETSQTITIPVLDDTIYEGTETLKVVLSNPVGCTIGTAEATGTILDNDPAPGPTVLALDSFAGMATGDALLGRVAPVGGTWRRPLLPRYPAQSGTNAAPPVPVVSDGAGAVQVASTHWDQTSPNDTAWKPGEHQFTLPSPVRDGYTECVFQVEDSTDQAGVTIREVESDGTRLSIVVAVNSGNFRAEIRRLNAGTGAGTDSTSRLLYAVVVLGPVAYGTPTHLGVEAVGTALRFYSGATELTPASNQNGGTISGNTLTIPAAQNVAGHPGIQHRNRGRILAVRHSDAFQSTPLAAA